MSEQQTVDLKQLLYLIDQNKNTRMHLNLDEGCTIQTDQPDALVKVINYIINYLQQLTDRPLDIGLELRSDSYVMNFMVLFEGDKLPELSGDKMEAALKDYNASHELIHEQGRYVQFKITFNRK